MFYLMTHSTHFYFTLYMVLYIWSKNFYVSEILTMPLQVLLIPISSMRSFIASPIHHEQMLNN